MTPVANPCRGWVENRAYINAFTLRNTGGLDLKHLYDYELKYYNENWKDPGHDFDHTSTQNRYYYLFRAKKIEILI